MIWERIPASVMWYQLRGSWMTKSTNTHDSDVPAGTQTARLSSLVDQAKTLMDQLCDISSTQSDAIKSGDIDQIVEIVTKREPMVRGLVCIGEEIGVFISDPKMIGAVDDTQRSDALNRIASIEQSMKELREHDAQDQKLMESTRDGLADQLASMGAGMNALRAYTSRTATPNPILQDRQG